MKKYGKKRTEDFLSHCKTTPNIDYFAKYINPRLEKNIMHYYNEHIKMGNKQSNQRYLFVFSSFRYFKVEGLGDASNWKKAITNYMCNSCCEKLELISTISRYCPVQSSDYLTLQEQFLVLSRIPNVHRWEAKKK